MQSAYPSTVRMVSVCAGIGRWACDRKESGGGGRQHKGSPSPMQRPHGHTRQGEGSQGGEPHTPYPTPSVTRLSHTPNPPFTLPCAHTPPLRTHPSLAHAPSRVSPLAADEYSPADSVEMTVPPRRAMADSNDSRVCGVWQAQREQPLCCRWRCMAAGCSMGDGWYCRQAGSCSESKIAAAKPPRHSQAQHRGWW